MSTEKNNSVDIKGNLNNVGDDLSLSTSKLENLEQVEQGGGKVIETPSSPLLKKSEKTKAKQAIQCKNMIIVINNWNLEQKSTLLEFFKKNCDKYIFGEEIGESGTPHLQGAFVLKKKARFTEIFKKLGFTCHLEKMVSNWDDQIKYCSKGKNVVSYPVEYTGQDLPAESELYDWQREVVEIVKTEPDDRTIHWYYDLTGKCGKSKFCKYLNHHYDAIRITGGKRADVINNVYNSKKKEVVLMDIPRICNKISYAAIEEIKNGFITNDKYETGSCLFLSPHLFVFSNFFPDVSAFSKDRWVIKNINDDDPDYQRYMDANFGSGVENTPQYF